MIDIQWNPTRRELRLFGLIGLPAPLLILALVSWLRLGWLVVPVLLIALAAGSIAAGIVAPRVLRPISVGLSLLGFPIAWLVSHLLLAVVYFCFVTPIGWLLRRLGHDPLDRRVDRNRATYWVERQASRTPEDYLRQF
jgi:carbamoyltransferase